MTTVSEYKLTHAPHQVAGGILIDPANGDQGTHILYLTLKYGNRLASVVWNGEQVFPPVVGTVSHAS